MEIPSLYSLCVSLPLHPLTLPLAIMCLILIVEGLGSMTYCSAVQGEFHVKTPCSTKQAESSTCCLTWPAAWYIFIDCRPFVGKVTNESVNSSPALMSFFPISDQFLKRFIDCKYCCSKHKRNVVESFLLLSVKTDVWTLIWTALSFLTKCLRCLSVFNVMMCSRLLYLIRTFRFTFIFNEMHVALQA